MRVTVGELAKYLQGELVGDGSVVLTGVAPADRAQAGQLTFAENEQYLALAERSAASAILVSSSLHSTVKPLIRVPNARVAFARVLELFCPEPTPPPGVHPSAVVAPSAIIDPTAHIGPLCVVGERVRIGPRSALLGGNHVGEGCQLGEDVRLFPNVVLYPGCQIGHRVRIHAGTVIGSDGFGYVLDQGVHRKIPQVGTVIIQDDVEIGANVTIDRATLGATIIGRGTKIDNLVQIAHNVVIGQHCIIVAQDGISGSTRLGDYVTLAGQVGLAGHLKIGNRVTVGAKAGVMNDIPDGQKWLGIPARPDRQMKRIFVALDKLPDLLRRVSVLEKMLGQPRPEDKLPET
jgi:UDP-3-O-[3-hydroxymyristoyl] glucosamine N-acyltransferase